MGYYIEPLRYGEWDFRIKKENFEAIIDAFHKHELNRMSQSASLWIARHATNECRRYNDIVDLFQDMGYSVEFDKSGNIDGIIHNKEKLWNDEADFNLMAPWVEEGSVLDFIGEDGSIWRWYFDGESMQEYYGEVIFPTAPPVRAIRR